MRGGSQSHLMRCSDGNYYVVKFQYNPQGTRILVNELLGTKLAALLGLPTTAFSIIEVSKDLIQLTEALCFEVPRTPSGWHRIPCKAGLQFGSCYLGDPHHVTSLDMLPDDKILRSSNLSDFLGMLVFDIWTGNTDGRQVIFGRTEVGTSYQAWMIDQGFCFNAGEWNFPDAPRRGLHGRNVVYLQVRGIESFEPWLSILESEIGAQVLMDIAKTVPPEWYEPDSGSFQCLIERLDSRRNKVRELIRSAVRFSPRSFPHWCEKKCCNDCISSRSSLMER